MSGAGENGSVMRRAPTGAAAPVPAQNDLLIETSDLEAHEPSLPNELSAQINRLILEQQQREKLEKAGLMPMHTAVFVGPPGVGKTMSAHWIAKKLVRPIYTLNLASITSSLFGRTGANLREALEHAQSRPSVLLLDEFDAIAKGRGEDDIGEAKRMVTVLLQQIDRWPSHAVLIAATNHGELLDRAVWRRFHLRLDFPAASVETALAAARMAFAKDDDGKLAALVADLMEGQPLSAIVSAVLSARKRSLLFREPLDQAVVQSILETGGHRSRKDAHRLALALVAKGRSQRQVSELTGISRDTLRKKLKDHDDGSN
tara:strand:+ start:1320 stop:2267 length:948 start_codon:yes stop_codon:yes gene_type:complete